MLANPLCCQPGLGQQMQFDQLKRREFITLVGGSAAAWPFAARAQQPAGNIPKIGLLWPGVSTPPSPRMESFRKGLREQGYVDGRNVVTELRYPREGPQHFPALAADLVRMNVDVICAMGDLAPKLAQQATRTIPIVTIADDIVGAGLVTSLSRPGGNITGIDYSFPGAERKAAGGAQKRLSGDHTSGRSLGSDHRHGAGAGDKERRPVLERGSSSRWRCGVVKTLLQRSKQRGRNALKRSTSSRRHFCLLCTTKSSA
jgi:hypothetical protein